MQNYSTTTPFGRRPYTLEQMRAQVETNEREDGKSIGKWKVFDALKRSKDFLGISDRALTVLNALLTFHRSDDLSGEEPIIVFPSNKSLALRAHGMFETTLRTYLSSLVALGLIIRRDSPNGKRYARKGQGATSTLPTASTLALCWRALTNSWLLRKRRRSKKSR